MFKNREYILDKDNLQFKRERLPFKVKAIRYLKGFAVSIVLTIIYIAIFNRFFGDPKEKFLTQRLADVKLNYSIVATRLNNSMSALDGFRLSDDTRYRPILEMDSVPETYRQVGIGGIDHYSDLVGFENSDILISYRSKLYTVSNMAKVQQESFKAIGQRANEWKTEMDHQPMISPVDVKYRLSDGFRFRDVHPVFGTPKMHYGQDFGTPIGTEVYATGNGTISETGSYSSGYGTYIVIDHGYGLRTTYGHLSRVAVKKGEYVRRGDLIALSGNTGTSSGPHLHYEIAQFGRHKNPIHFFNDDINAEEYNEMIQVLSSRSKYR